MKPIEVINKLNELNVDNVEKNTIEELNNELKNISTFSEFEKLEKEIANTGYGLVFRTRKAKWHAYGFTEVEDNKVHYLLSDGVSTRIQPIKDLWKYIEVSNSAR